MRPNRPGRPLYQSQTPTVDAPKEPGSRPEGRPRTGRPQAPDGGLFGSSVSGPSVNPEAFGAAPLFTVATSSPRPEDLAGPVATVGDRVVPRNVPQYGPGAANALAEYVRSLPAGPFNNTLGISDQRPSTPGRGGDVTSGPVNTVPLDPNDPSTWGSNYSPFSPNNPFGIPDEYFGFPSPFSTLPEPPPGVIPGSPEYARWAEETLGNKRSPLSQLLELQYLTGSLGGLINPIAGLFGFGNNPAQIADTFRDIIGQYLGSLNLLPENAPSVVAPEVPLIPYDIGTFNTIFGAGREAGREIFGAGQAAGREAAGYIDVPEVRSIEELSEIFKSISPESMALLDAIRPERERIASESAEGLGILGIPQEQIRRLQNAGLDQVNFAQRENRRALDDRLGATGQFGTGQESRALADLYSQSYAPARTSAVIDPWNQAYELGVPLLNALTETTTGIEGPIAQLSAQGNAADLDRRLQAQAQQGGLFAQLAGQGLSGFASLAGQGLSSGASAGAASQSSQQSGANFGAQLNLQAQLALLESFLNQQGRFGTLGQNSLNFGQSTFQNAAGNYNNLLLSLVQSALGQSENSKAREFQRDAQQQAQLTSLLSGVGQLGGAALGAFMGAPGLGTIGSLGGSTSVPGVSGSYDLGISAPMDPFAATTGIPGVPPGRFSVMGRVDPGFTSGGLY